MISLKNILVELEFKTPEEFKKYKAKHKMRPGTVVNVAGKDKVVGDDKPKAPKTPTFVNDDGDVVANDFDSAMDLAQNLGMSDEELDYIEKEKDMESLGDYLDGQGYSQKQADKPKSDKPVKLDDDAQQAIDDMDWNRYDDQGITNVNKVINDLDDNVDEWNQQIYNTIEELEGQIPQEDLDKLYSAEVDVMDLDDEALSAVPREELEKKTNALIDFHKKYSTIGRKTTAQEKDPNRDKKTGPKPGSSFGSNIGYRTGRNRGGGMYDNVNPKSSTPLKELSKITTRYNK